MYVASDQATGGVIAPESRTEFYSKITYELLINRRLRQTGPIQGRLVVKEQRETILGRLAFGHLKDSSQPANSLDWQEALKIVVDVTGCDENDADRNFRQMSIDTGLFTEERPDESYRFIHLTFCEFLAAVEAARGREAGVSELVECIRVFGVT